MRQKTRAMEKEEIRNKLKRCSKELEECYMALINYQLEPEHILLESIKEAIGSISLATLQFKKTQEELKVPWKNKCAFCKKDEDDTRPLIKGPGVFICSDCVRVCQDILASKSNEGFGSE